MKKFLHVLSLCLGLIVVSVAAALAQTGSVKGTILDDETGEAIVGANILIKGTTNGVITDADGKFALENVPAGSLVLVISFIGYDNRELSVDVSDGRAAQLGSVRLGAQTIGLDEISIIASVAIDRKTPVAVSTVKGATIEARMGNQEFVEVLRSTPSIYVTKQGGGFGDSRINVRGFDQRNTAVMINGIPVNDMENGWVYWSNWAGLSDVTNSLQVQRGLSASRLAISSVGGTINIVTNAINMEKGGSASLTIGNDGYLKYGATYSTGLSQKGWAFTVQATRTVGDGFVGGTAFSAYSYFASIAKKFNEKHSLHLTAVGAPQWHNQRTLSTNDAITIDSMEAKGIRYNPQWGNKNGDEFSWVKNFYHKPKIFLNHYWTISEKTELATSAYVSIGRGGGSGDMGRINGSYRTSTKFRNDNGVRFDDIVRWNSGGTVADFGADNTPWSGGGGFDGQYVGVNAGPGSGFIRRSSMNEHNWYGVLSTLTHHINNEFTFSGGLDLRYYKGMHYRRVEDLLGLDAFFDDDDINNPEKYITGEGKDGGKIDYYNDGLVKWIGAFGQVEYSHNNFSAFLSGSYSNQAFQRIDYFLYTPEEQKSDWEAFGGGTLKAGFNYNIGANHNIFINGGKLWQQPIFDNIFLNNTNTVNEDAEDQKVTSIEVGYGYRSRYATVNVNAYNTEWTDRQISRNTTIDDEDGTANFFGVGQIHQGVELEISVSPIEGLNLTGMTSFGNWRYKDDFSASVYDEDQQFIGELSLYMKDVKIPDAAQATFSIGADYEIIRRLKIYGNYYYADKIYADFNVATDGTFLTEGKQAWQLPSYSLVDTGVSYGFKIGGLDVTWRLNINNLLDKEYISESETNKLFDAGDATADTEVGKRGSSTNIVYYGLGRTWNTSIKVKF